MSFVDCNRCKERIDRSEIIKFSVITIRGTERTTRNWLCSDCTDELEKYISSEGTRIVDFSSTHKMLKELNSDYTGKTGNYLEA